MQITKAFELVSTAKLRRARNKMDVGKLYFDTMQRTIEEAIGSDQSIRSLFLTPTEKKNPLIILVTADKGLCGGYNINAIKTALDIVPLAQAKYIVFGKKGYDFLSERQADIVESVLYASENPSYDQAKSIANQVVSAYKKKEIDSVFLVYTEFVTTISQVPNKLQLLPLMVSENEIKTEKGFEVTHYAPSVEDVLAYVIPKYLESVIYGGWIESAASEQAARRVAMESATENAEEIIDELTLSFNQARQAVITQEISEIVGGAEALK